MADIPGGPTPPPPPPPPGTTPGSGGLPPRGIGEVLSAAFDIYRNNAANLLLIVAVVVVPLSFVSALLARAFAATETTVEIGGQPVTQLESRSLFVVLVAALVVVAIGVIIGAILQAAILRGAAQATIGDPVDIEASYRWGLRRFGSVLLISLLVGLVVAVGFILLIIPGIVFGVFLSVAIPALVVENRRGTEALKRSWNLVSGYFWHALAVLVVAAIIAAVVGLILGLIGGSNWFVSWIFSAIAQIITAPFTALVGIVLYLDLRARKEALSANMLRGELASNV